MAEFINHNSFILFSVIVILIAGGMVLRRGVEIKRLVPFGIFVVFIVAAFFAFKPLRRHKCQHSRDYCSKSDRESQSCSSSNHKIDWPARQQRLSWMGLNRNLQVSCL